MASDSRSMYLMSLCVLCPYALMFLMSYAPYVLMYGLYICAYGIMSLRPDVPYVEAYVPGLNSDVRAVIRIMSTT